MYPRAVEMHFKKCTHLDIQDPGESVWFLLSMSFPRQHRRVHLLRRERESLAEHTILEIIKVQASLPVSHAHANSFDYILGDLPRPGSEPVSRR